MLILIMLILVHLHHPFQDEYFRQPLLTQALEFAGELGEGFYNSLEVFFFFPLKSIFYNGWYFWIDSTWNFHKNSIVYS